jgi:hypothetical protein
MVVVNIEIETYDEGRCGKSGRVRKKVSAETITESKEGFLRKCLEVWNDYHGEVE